MSMNLTLSATRQVIVMKTGAQDEQTIRCELWQTPTTVTYACLDAENTEQAYFEWVLRHDKYGPNHVEEVIAFIAKAADEGYEIEWGEI